MIASLFEIFKIGIGPSSSHTVGPMRAAARFVAELAGLGLLDHTNRVEAELFGSLALTGGGHGTSGAIWLGLMGETPEGVDIEQAPKRVAAAEALGRTALGGVQDAAVTIVFHADRSLPEHPNGMRFSALQASGETLRQRVYYSVGGGFVVEEGGAEAKAEHKAPLPYPFHTAAELLEVGEAAGLPVWRLVLENEKVWRPEAEVRSGVARLWATMHDCMRRGWDTRGVLPGGLGVKRRAPQLYESLTATDGEQRRSLDWLNVCAMAVNEENAAGGRVVTAPTNGAAGIVPAVAQHYLWSGGDDEGLFRYFLTAAAVGLLYKENASLSGAEVGCQGEVGVACSMAAGGLVAALGGSNEQVEHAAEMAMEHNLGMTCDPVAGLVQIPCIERNAFGAVKAANAARLAMQEEADHRVSLDQVIRTMYQTGLDMQSKYKETSLGGLAVHVIEC
jgi:L-serine dehydratase